MKYQIIQGDNRETLKNIADNSIDAIVTDPPYGIDFLGKQWDVNTGELETYEECLRVLKPGGHILAFSAARTYHHLAMTLERAGFEIRDQIMWIYSSGFPKSQDIGKSIQRKKGVEKTVKNPNARSKKGDSLYEGGFQKEEAGDNIICTDPEALQWAGWGTSLKPAHEPIALARKPIKGSIKDNVQKWGTGGLNIDATRISYETEELKAKQEWNKKYPYVNGRTNTHSNQWERTDQGEIVDGETVNEQGRFPANVVGEIQEDYQKYFYCPKVSRKERHMGFDLTTIATQPEGKFDRSNDPGNGNERILNKGVPTYKEMILEMGGMYVDKDGNEQDINIPSKDIKLPEDGYIKAHSLKDVYEKWCIRHNKVCVKGNNHPTVKPVALMEYLIKLITPPGGTVLDPFNGSGSTGMAATGLGFNYIGLELDPNYVAITEKRIEAWLKKDEPEEETTSTFKELFEQCP